MITEAPPILLLKRGSSGKVIGCGVIGDAFPDNFTANLSNSLRLLDLSPNVRWSNAWIFLGGRAKAKQTKPWYDYKQSDLGMHMRGCLEHPFDAHAWMFGASF